ncbi:hypothetical protein FOA52_014012 [Chlamydomonas sp. UWO 241]|nr:hypothetical protein FOA52_014012 [Chlamydomonas sp. UWO 241]
MRKRDFAILLVSCIAVLVSLQNEGTVSFRKAWYHNPNAGNSEEVLQSPHKLPAPIVADLNGDGHLEVIIATQDLKIMLVAPADAARRGSGFAPARVMTQVSLLYKRVFVTAGRRPVAMAVGYLDPRPEELVLAPRRQVLAVLTASWQVLCFDHNLKLMWEQDVRMKFPHHSHINEVALLVGPHQVRKGDRGLVVVGASLQKGDAEGEGLEVGSAGGAGSAFSDDDVLREEIRLEAEERQRARSAKETDDLEDVEEGGGGASVTRHFTYYALEGGRGEERWHHTPADFHRDLETLAGELQPQHNYKLDAEVVEGRHFGEASCREYRQSVLDVLPHAWTHPSDTWLQEAHFLRHREATGAQKQALAGQATAGARGSARSSTVIGGKAAGGSDANAGHNHVANRHNRHAAAAKGKDAPPAPGGGGGGPSHAGHHGQHSHTSNMTTNAIVAHLEEGIEVIHLFTGRTVCKLHLPRGALHADINGDGVVDHVQVFHGASSASDDTDADDNAHHPGSHCIATATSGIPPREPLFRINVCRTNRFMAGGLSGGNALAQLLDDEDVEHEGNELATPVLLPLPQLSHGYRAHSAQHGLVVFATSKGLLSAVNGRGDHVWANYFPSGWPAARGGDGGGGGGAVVPTLSVMALHRHAVPTTVLAAGSEAAVLVSEHGRLLDVLWLPAPPVQPLIVVDFNGDGLNDVIVVTLEGVFGYAQVQHYGGFTLSALLACLIVAMGVLFYTQHGGPDGDSRARSRKLRSTEYVD